MRTAQILSAATADFYERQAASFSVTRTDPWPGWERLASSLDLTQQEHLSVLDIGCGNLRFERYLTDLMGAGVVTAYGIDRCETLTMLGMPTAGDVRFQSLDITASLERGSLEQDITAPLCDLTVAFGLMHHIPLPAWRNELVRAMIARTRLGGAIVITFWQFTKESRLAKRAQRATERGERAMGISLDKDAGEWLLGWQQCEDVYRYCHAFADEEIDRLVEEACGQEAIIQDAFSADGAQGDLNRYVVLRCLR